MKDEIKATISGSSIERAKAVEAILGVAREASAVIARIYEEYFDVEYKGPNDPVTRADREANTLICARLKSLFPGFPIVSEEGDPAAWGPYTSAAASFFVDPLDGTREFIAKNGEFAVMIGLVEYGAPTLGVIVCPAEGRSFVGGLGVPASEVLANGDRRPLAVSKIETRAESHVLVTRSHRTIELDEVIAKLSPRRMTLMGGAGFKATRVAMGEADAYIYCGKAGKRWDTCAPEAIVTAAGGCFSDTLGQKFDYAVTDIENKHGLVATSRAIYEEVMDALHEAKQDAQRGR